MTVINQQDLIQAWCERLGLIDPNPLILEAIAKRVKSISLLRKEQHQLVTRLSELSGAPSKSIYTWLRSFDQKWTSDLDEVDLSNRISILETEIDQLDKRDTEPIAVTE